GHRSEGAWLASRAGLPIGNFGMSGRDPVEAGYYSFASETNPVTSLIMLRDEVIGGGAPDPIVEGCRRLMELADTDLLGIDFSVEPGGVWKFATASPFPDLSRGGDPLLQRLG